MLKYYVIILLRQFVKTLNWFLSLSRANENLEISMSVWYEKLKELNQFWSTLIEWYFDKWMFYQTWKISCYVKITLCSHAIFIWLSTVAKQLHKKFHFEFLHAFNFSSTWNKEVSSYWQNSLTFRHNGAYMVNSVVVNSPSVK